MLNSMAPKNVLKIERSLATTEIPWYASSFRARVIVKKLLEEKQQQAMNKVLSEEKRTTNSLQIS